MSRLLLALTLLLLVLGLQTSALTPAPASAQEPTTEPASEPTTEPASEPTTEPTQAPTAEPTQAPAPEPTQAPTSEPTQAPTTEPTQEATTEPPQPPTVEPTQESTVEPGQPTAPPTAEPTEQPAPLPAEPGPPPTLEPSEEPTPTVTATPDLSFRVAAAPPVYFVNLTVLDRNTQLPITDFTYLVNEDNAGTASDGDANQPSLKPMASYSPVVAAGDETTASPVGLPDIAASDFNPIAGDPDNPQPSNIDRYLISVRAPGYKLWGQHVRFTGAEVGQTKDVTVELIPEPLPLSKINVHVFHDNAPVNGEDDVPVETGLSGFHIVVEDTVGEVTVDWYGNPLCGGYCVTDANGNVTIANLPFGKYEVIAVPPNGSDWVQTTTIEGTHVIDAWIEEGNDGNSPREGFQQAAVWIGFVRPMDNWSGPDTGVIRGTVRYVVEWTPPINPITLGEAVYKPWVALTDIGGNDQQVYLARGNPDGSFQIDNVPDGEYQLAVWDEDLDAIISFFTVVVAGGQTVDLGEFGIPRWFGWISGDVFMDNGLDAFGNNIGGAGNALRDCSNPNDPSTCEVGISGIDLDTRYRDGSIQYATFTDNNGFYEFPEVFELEKFAVAEVGFGRFHRTGRSVFFPYDVNGPHGPGNPEVLPDDLGGGLLVNELTWAAKRTNIDWGKRPYAKDDPNTPEYEGENGGISGIVYYAVTRNEFEARLAAAEDYEPGIPGVTIRLYDAAGVTLLNEVQIDSWSHPTGCDALDSQGNPAPTDPDPLNRGPNCIEVPNISIEVKDGAFDGGYAFETMCPGCILPGESCEGRPDETALTPGDYVVEVAPPPFYQIVKEEDQNTDEGTLLQPAFPPPPCVGPLHLVNDSRNPFDGQQMPLCNRKLVTLQDQQNAAADFFLFTDSDDNTDPDPTLNNWTTGEAVPPAGRIFGFLLDDLNIETDPNFIYYGEKRGIPNTSVGIRDFTGRLISMLTTDENGIFEVVLPSTYMANCPIPSGVCPGMYRVVGNDPGDPDNPSPNFNPNYQTITFVFDVWPGKTTYADVALFPITAFTSFPGSQFGQPAQCLAPADQPQVFVVNPPYGNPGDTFTITGAGFDPASAVTLNGQPLNVTYVSGTQLNVTIPPDFAGGPGQLLVSNPNGRVSQNGLTFHVGQAPAFVVNPGESIQAAIDAASPGDLIVLAPGLHFGTVNLNKAVTLQGYGPGANDGFGTGGSVLDQRFILDPVGINIAGAPGQFTAALRPQIDGFRIINARDEQDVGGGIHVDVNGQFLIISNNVIQSNGGNFGGGITLGEPYRGDNNNDNIRIHHNRILNNGGFSLAGGIGIFNGADDYEIDHNEICGNYSGEYGGGISHFGLSRRGRIHHNLVYFNNAFDEGGGVMIAGEQPVAPATFTAGAGEVDIDHNLIQGNMSNDDGGGVRLLQPLDFAINISNNIIVNNVSTDFGGGIALDDASAVTIVNNTIARNANTSTSEDANGRHHIPNGAGVAVETYSAGFEAYLGIGPGGYVDPVMFNNIICENQAYTWDGANLLFNSIFDLQVFAGGAGQVLHPTASLLTDPNDVTESFAPHATNLACGDLNALFPSHYVTQLSAVPFRMEPDFITVIMVTVPQPITLQGNYHTQAAAPAVDTGAALDPLGSGAAAACDDYDHDGRPFNDLYDIGADEQPGLAPAPGCSAGGSFNLAPVVEAGLAQTITLPAAVNLSGTVNDDGLVNPTLIITWTVTGGPGAVTFAPNPNVITPTATFAAAGLYTLTLTAYDGQLTASDLVTVTVNPAGSLPVADLYLSLVNNGGVAGYTVGAVSGVRDEDILGFNDATDTFMMVFDGSDVGINGGQDLDAFDIVDGGSAILISFESAASLDLNGDNILDPVDDSDIVKFTGSAYGATTAGTFSMFLRGVDVGLTTPSEDVDAIDLLPDGTLLISTRGPVTVPGGVSGVGQDILAFTPATPNFYTSGAWGMYFDGSDVGLGAAGENIDAVSSFGGDIYLSTTGDVAAPFIPPNPGVDAQNDDVFICAAPTTGPNTACTSGSLYFDGAAFGLGGNDIDGIDRP